jgi:hypothetical protein
MRETRRFKLTVLANNADVLPEHWLMKATTLLLHRIGLRVTQFEEIPPATRWAHRQDAKKRQRAKWKS